MGKNLFGMKDEEIKTIFRSVRAPRTLEAEIKALEEEIAKEQKRRQAPMDNNCANGKHCQRIVNEAELEALLTEGWSVAAVLPSGKIVVSNDYTLRFFFCEKCAFALEKKLGLKLSAKIHKMGRLMLCYVTRHTPSETVKIR